MRFKKIITSVMAIAMIGVMTGCSKTVEETTKVSDANETTLRLGVMGSIDAIPLVIAKEKGYFEQQGINLDLQIFKAAKEDTYVVGNIGKPVIETVELQTKNLF